MGHMRITPQRRFNTMLLRCRGVLLLLATAGFLSACGGGGETISSTGSSSVTLAWDAVTEPNLAGYRIYYGTAPRTYLQPFGQGINVGNVTTYTVTGLSSGTRYYFAATAFSTSNVESGFSNEVLKDIP